ncbi:hypothetical protein GE09DRAFT_478154 [Coniochaeta sp. 2T2.1]|nr:hypothetical protein GE09DRAFT_478154 [Coniochaeta sp. 2T2.1]
MLSGTPTGTYRYKQKSQDSYPRPNIRRQPRCGLGEGEMASTRPLFCEGRTDSPALQRTLSFKQSDEAGPREACISEDPVQTRRSLTRGIGTSCGARSPALSGQIPFQRPGWNCFRNQYDPERHTMPGLKHGCAVWAQLEDSLFHPRRPCVVREPPPTVPHRVHREQVVHVTRRGPQELCRLVRLALHRRARPACCLRAHLDR